MVSSASLDAALSGMLAHERNMELIANNLANVNTTGYKRAMVHFQDLLDSSQILDALNGDVPEGGILASSSGVTTAGVGRDFVQGVLRPSERALDFAVNGDGFFRVRLEDGSLAYTRSGALRLDAQRRLTTENGNLLDPPVQLPAEYWDLRVDTDGAISVMRRYTDAELAELPADAPRDGVREQVGQIAIVRFTNPAGMEAIGHSLYRETAESQAPIEGTPGQDGMGTVLSGWLEASNVDVSTEMISLVLASRAYQLNLAAYRTIEKMLSEANTLASA